MLSKQINQDIFVLNYPLLPHTNVDDLMSYINRMLRDYADSYDSITLMGDSAGANILLGFSQSDFYSKHKIDKLIALSPFVDFSLNNLEIEKVEKRDTIVSSIALKEIREYYSLTRESEDKLISPIFGDFSKINVTMVSGTRDITNPDTKKMAEKFKNINYIERNKLPHVFMLYQMLPEAKEVNNLIINELNKGM